MIQYTRSTVARVPVRLFDNAGAPVAGIVFGAVTAAVEKGDAATAIITVDGTNWSEVTAGAFSGVGAYNLLIPISATGVLGPLLYSVSVTGAKTYLGAIQIIPPPTSAVSFLANGDTVNPVIVQVASPKHMQLRVTFSEPVVMTAGSNGALNLGNYSVPGLTLLAVVSITPQQVMLTTSPQTPDFLYTLSVSNIEDLVGNPIL